MTRPLLTFKFTVENGKFIYDPPGDWGYTHDNRVRFESHTGRFKIQFKPKAGVISANFQPLGKLVDSLQTTNPCNAEVDVNDGLTQPERQMLVRSMGFIAQYFYEISVLIDGKWVTAEHNGTHHC